MFYLQEVILQHDLIPFSEIHSIFEVGCSLEFSFKIKNITDRQLKVRLEYGLYYLLANGSHSKKVFKISEKEYEPKEERHVTRKQSFKPITTRKYYEGLHKVALIINGSESDSLDFTLKYQG